jgi:phosphoribosylformimino-5-aminoimidazole carboxamide ribotide isomerase
MAARRVQVIPAVDVLGEEAVRLAQGDFAEVVARTDDPAALAERFARAGAPLVHVVDLDGARSGRVRPELVRRIAAGVAPAAVQASGGVRRPGDVETLLAAGAARVVVGTAAFASPGALRAYARFGGRLAVAIDVRGVRPAARGEPRKGSDPAERAARRGSDPGARRIAVAGWLEDGGLTVAEALERCCESGVERLLCTAVERDGTLEGPDLELVAWVVERSGLPVMAAGGIRSEADLDALGAAGAEAAVVGRALLEGRIALSRSGSSGQPG